MRTTTAWLASGLAISWVFASTGTLRAQEAETITVTASRLGGDPRDVPRSITTLNEAFIQDQLAISSDLGALLGRSVPGISTGVEGRFNGEGQSQIRGRRLQVVVDGVVSNNNFLDFNQELLAVDPELVERIDVIRGGTAIYGFGATGGVIAITTRRLHPGDDPSFTSKMSFGFDATHPSDSLNWTAYQDASASFGAFDARISGKYETRQSRFDANGNRIPEPSAGSFDQTHDHDFSARFGLQLDETQRLELEGSFFHLIQDDDWGSVGSNPVTRVPGTAVHLTAGIADPAVYALFKNAPAVSFDSRLYRASYDNTDLLGSRLNLTGYYQDKSNATVFARQALTNPTQTIYSRNLPDQTRKGSRLTIDTPIDGIPYLADTILAYGFDYEWQRFVQPNVNNLDPVTPPIVQNAYAGFAQLSFKVLDGVRIDGGYRYEYLADQINTFRISRTFAANLSGKTVLGGELHFHKWIPNFGAVVPVLGDGLLDAYASYAEGFTVGELLRAVRNTTASSVKTSTEARPQVVENYEVGVRGKAEQIAYSTAIFYSESPYGATFQPDPVTGINYIQRAPEKVWGLESTLDAQVREWLNAGGTISFQQGIRYLAGQGNWRPLPGNRIAPFKLTAYAEAKAMEGVRLRLEGVYTGSRNEFPGSTATNEGRVQGQFVADFAAYIDLFGGQLQVGIKNLFDSLYVQPAVQALNNTDFYNAEGTSVTVGYRITW